jgi:hypothetical protein
LRCERQQIGRGLYFGHQHVPFAMVLWQKTTSELLHQIVNKKNFVWLCFLARLLLVWKIS